jgi:hypothetical protein
MTDREVCRQSIFASSATVAGIIFEAWQRLLSRNIFDQYTGNLTTRRSVLLARINRGENSDAPTSLKAILICGAERCAEVLVWSVP